MLSASLLLTAVLGRRHRRRTGDRLLQSSFGSERKYRFNFSSSKEATVQDSVTAGPSGTSFSHALGSSSQQGIGLSEVEVPAWELNDTIDLNNDKDTFVLQVSPSAEFANFGGRPVVGFRGGLHLPFEVINQFAHDALTNTANTYLPGGEKPRQFEAPSLPARLVGKRVNWLSILKSTADKIKNIT